MNPPHQTIQAAQTIIYKVTPDKMFIVEQWNGDPAPQDVCEDIRNTGFTPLAGTGTCFLWLGSEWQDGAYALSRMQILRLL